MQGPPSPAMSVLQIWVAVYDLLYEDPASAQEKLAGVSAYELPEFYQESLQLFGTMAHGMAAGEPYSSVCQQLAELQEHLNPFVLEDKLVRWIGRRYRERLAKLQGRTLTSLWLSVRRLFTG